MYTNYKQMSEKSSLSLIIRKYQTKPVIPVKIVLIKMIIITNRGVEEREVYTVGGSVNKTLCKAVWWPIRKLERELQNGPASIPLYG